MCRVVEEQIFDLHSLLADMQSATGILEFTGDSLFGCTGHVLQSSHNFLVEFGKKVKADDKEIISRLHAYMDKSGHH